MNEIHVDPTPAQGPGLLTALGTLALAAGYAGCLLVAFWPTVGITICVIVLAGIPMWGGTN